MTDIQLPYVQAFRDRHGLMRYYVRKRGLKRVALPGLPGSKPFMDAYHAALGSGPAPGTPKGGPRSLAALLASYYTSPEFKNLKPGAQKTYRHVLKSIEAQDGHRNVHDLPEDKARKIIQEIGADRPALANLTSKVLRTVFNHAVDPLKWCKTNPFAGIKLYKIGEHRAWADQEVEKYTARWPLGTRERLAFDLHYYTDQRISDVTKMRCADTKGEMFSVFVKQKKTDVELMLPIHKELLRSLNAYGGTRGEYLIGRLDGKRISTSTLRHIMKKAAAEAGLPKDCVPHGIRKTACRHLAHAGASNKEIQSVSGHKTLAEIERYTESAEQARLARSAIARLPALPNSGVALQIVENIADDRGES